MHTRHNTLRKSNDNFSDNFTHGYEAMLATPKDQLFEGLIHKSKSLLNIATKEASLLNESNLTAFTALQQDKQDIAQGYADACKAFSTRIEEYRGTPPILLDRLESLQKQIAGIAKKNNKAVAALTKATHENTASTLFSAQDIGQNNTPNGGHNGQ